MTKTLTPQRSAWEVPANSVALQLQRDRQGAHNPAPKSYFHIPKAGSHHRSQRIAKAAI